MWEIINGNRVNFPYFTRFFLHFKVPEILFYIYDNFDRECGFEALNKKFYQKCEINILKSLFLIFW